MKWQGSSSDYTSSIPGLGDTVKVPLMYHWTANLEMVVNRAEVLLLSHWTPDTLAMAADEKSSLTINAAIRECYHGFGGESLCYPQPTNSGLIRAGKHLTDAPPSSHSQKTVLVLFCFQSFGWRTCTTCPQRFVSSHVGSFMLFNTLLTTFSRSFRALCSSSSDLFIFLFSCDAKQYTLDDC